MSAASVRISESCAIVLDAVRATQHTTKGVLLTLEGRTPGDALSCAIIPLERVGAVIASLQLVAEQARKA